MPLELNAKEAHANAMQIYHPCLYENLLDLFVYSNARPPLKKMAFHDVQHHVPGAINTHDVRSGTNSWSRSSIQKDSPNPEKAKPIRTLLYRSDSKESPY